MAAAVAAAVKAAAIFFTFIGFIHLSIDLFIYSFIAFLLHLSLPFFFSQFTVQQTIGRIWAHSWAQGWLRAGRLILGLHHNFGGKREKRVKDGKDTI